MRRRIGTYPRVGDSPAKAGLIPHTLERGKWGIARPHAQGAAINAKNFNADLGFGEGGIFISDKEYINSFAAVFATLCLLNFMFLKLNVSKISRIKILRNNEPAIHYNKLLGYKLMPGQEEVENQMYELHVDDYKIIGEKLNKAAAILSDQNSELKYSGEVSEKNMDAINQLL